MLLTFYDGYDCLSRSNHSVSIFFGDLLASLGLYSIYEGYQGIDRCNIVVLIL
jgi:hypothetical protein